MGESQGESVVRMLEEAEALITAKAYKSALRSFSEWQRSCPEERRRDELNSAAVFLARRSTGMKWSSPRGEALLLAHRKIENRSGKEGTQHLQWPRRTVRCSCFQVSSEADHGYVFATTEGHRWSPSAAASEVKKICVSAGVRSLSLHSFRRGGATSALDNGTDVNAGRRRGEGIVGIDGAVRQDLCKISQWSHSRGHVNVGVIIVWGVIAHRIQFRSV
ncbi:hypothetical protein Y032_0020g102 [Ancylostoma ceylanicum]|uniref:Tyr recombinase domain-containing protein n=1 Tax=Ancylostoma ceylanicum TaxID=53326 RepID=A0A016V1E0_9BILA|nr:hypothetical protein Y032_0020g102 [Ancylostoma ceylanicum]